MPVWVYHYTLVVNGERVDGKKVKNTINRNRKRCQIPEPFFYCTKSLIFCVMGWA